MKYEVKTELNNHRTDDGRRAMPKLKCPLCGKRCADVADAKLRNKSVLKPLEVLPDADYIIECPHCHEPLALSIKDLRAPASVARESMSVSVMTAS